MAYPKWRHHPNLESVIVISPDFEVSVTPYEDGWRDDRNFGEVTAEPVKNKGGRPRKVVE